MASKRTMAEQSMMMSDKLRSISTENTKRVLDRLVSISAILPRMRAEKLMALVSSAVWPWSRL